MCGRDVGDVGVGSEGALQTWEAKYHKGRRAQGWSLTHALTHLGYLKSAKMKGYQKRWPPPA